MQSRNQFNTASLKGAGYIGAALAGTTIDVNGADGDPSTITNGYHVYQQKHPEEWYTRIATTTNNSIVVDHLEEGSTYTFVVTRFNGAYEREHAELADWHFAIEPVVLVGSSSNETFTTKFTLTSVFAQSGNDTILAGTNTLSLNGYGQGGRDLLDMSRSTNVMNVRLNGGAHNDTLIAGRGTNSLTGEDHVDKFVVGWQAYYFGKNAITDFNLTDVPDYMETNVVEKARRGDKLVIGTAVGFDPATSDPAKWVQILPSGDDAAVRVDYDGPGTEARMTNIARLQGFAKQTGMTNASGQPITVPYLYTNGNLIIENHPKPAAPEFLPVP